jgi:DNA-binding IclR family transcriptional regulator
MRSISDGHALVTRPSTARAPQGIQSLETGGALLHALVARSRPTMLKDLAADAGMPPAKAHRYLVSFVRLGLVAQDPATGWYELGAFALQMGLAALGRVDAVRLAAPVMSDLAASLGTTVAAAVWGNRGPTIVRWEESTQAVIVYLRAGAVMPLLASAMGRCFAAWLPSARTAALLEAELAVSARARRPGLPASRRAMAAMLETIRTHGIAQAEGTLLPGINAVAVPVFDHRGEVVLALSALGYAGGFDSRLAGAPARALLAASRGLSARLGARA